MTFDSHMVEAFISDLRHAGFKDSHIFFTQDPLFLRVLQENTPYLKLMPGPVPMGDNDGMLTWVAMVAYHCRQRLQEQSGDEWHFSYCKEGGSYRCGVDTADGEVCLSFESGDVAKWRVVLSVVMEVELRWFRNGEVPNEGILHNMKA